MRNACLLRASTLQTTQAGIFTTPVKTVYPNPQTNYLSTKRYFYENDPQALAILFVPFMYERPDICSGAGAFRRALR